MATILPRRIDVQDDETGSSWRRAQAEFPVRFSLALLSD